MNVNWMGIHAEIREAYPHAIAEPDGQRSSARKDAAVESENVEVEHHRRIGLRSSRLDEPFIQENREVAIDSAQGRIAWMDDEESVRSHPDLYHFVEVRVIHLCPGLFQR